MKKVEFEIRKYSYKIWKFSNLQTAQVGQIIGAYRCRIVVGEGSVRVQRWTGRRVRPVDRLVIQTVDEVFRRRRFDAHQQIFRCLNLSGSYRTGLDDRRTRSATIHHLLHLRLLLLCLFKLFVQIMVLRCGRWSLYLLRSVCIAVRGFLSLRLYPHFRWLRLSR